MGGSDFLFLTVGCHNQSELDLLPPVIHRLAGRFPTLHPSVKLIPFKSMANLLEEERIHVMFGFQQDKDVYKRQPWGDYTPQYTRARPDIQ